MKFYELLFGGCREFTPELYARGAAAGHSGVTVVPRRLGDENVPVLSSRAVLTVRDGCVTLADAWGRGGSLTLKLPREQLHENYYVQIIDAGHPDFQGFLDACERAGVRACYEPGRGD